MTFDKYSAGAPRGRDSQVSLPVMGITPEEGVIRFTLDYAWSAPDPDLDISDLSTLRRQLWQLGLIGQSPERYDGVGYGNVSQRIGDSREFLVSGTQTGAIEWLGAEHYARVTGVDCACNHVTATGPIRPSSESLTHAMLYELDASIAVVLHVHSPGIWQAAASWQLPVTQPGIDYGTPAMAQEVARLFSATDVRARGVFVMCGHRDGVVAFGGSMQSAGQVLLACYEESRVSRDASCPTLQPQGSKR